MYSGSLQCTFDEQTWEMLRQIHKHGDDQIRALLSEYHSFKDSYDDMNFTPPYLSKIEAATLIVHGDRDQLFPISMPVEIYQSIPRSYLWIMPNGGHILLRRISRNPELFTRTVLEFLRGEW